MTATERDDPRVVEDEEDPKVHCAVHNPDDSVEVDSKARRRARARESSPESAQSQDESALDHDATTEPPAVTWSDRITGARDAWTPPDIWSHERPSLSQMWAYAARGDWTGSDGAPRRVGQIYALAVAVPVVAVAYSVAWAAERASRLAALIVLLVLLAQVPPLTWLI